MHISNLLFVLVLSQSATLGFASPAMPSPLTIRSPLCANLPDTIAGAVPHHLGPRASAIIWCLENSPVYIIPAMDALPITPTLIPSIQALLENATTTLLQHIEAFGDGPVTSWTSRWPPNPALSPHNLVLVGQAVDVGKGGLNWTVLEGAFLAFWDYLQYKGFGYGQFRIFAGEGQVGRGALRQGR